MKKPRNSIYVIITERDCDHPLDSHGPIIMETYIKDANNLAVIAGAAERFIGRYGEVFIGRVEVIGTLEEVNSILKETPNE